MASLESSAILASWSDSGQPLSGPNWFPSRFKFPSQDCEDPSLKLWLPTLLAEGPWPSSVTSVVICVRRVDCMHVCTS